MLKLYNEKIFYRITDASLGKERVSQLRRELLSNASGEALEIGFGSGLNLACYPDTISKITAIDVNPREAYPTHPRTQVCMQTMSAEALSFPDASFDTVVSTFTLCSVLKPEAALREIKRVLKPNGKFLFLEHGKSPNRYIAGLQNLTNPLYNLFAGGCNVNRDMLQLIAASGLCIQSSQVTQVPSMLAGLYFYGVAVSLHV